MEKSQFSGITILDEGESIVADDGAFTGRDRETIDFFLERGAKTHRHTGLSGLSNPIGAPSGTAVASGGTIPPDLDLSIGFTLQDDSRGETTLSPVATVTTADPLSRPQNAPSATVNYTAGSLTVDSYYYGITYVDASGGETPLGPTTIAQRQPGYANARVLLTGLTTGMATASATAWRLYRARSGGQFAYLASGTAANYTDDGSVSPICDTQPPEDEFNTTNSINSLLVYLPPLAALGNASYINVYVSTDGDFSGNVFLEQFPVSSAGATVIYRGLELLPDQPPDVSTTVGDPPKIDAASEIDWGQTFTASGLASGAAGNDSIIGFPAFDVPKVLLNSTTGLTTVAGSGIGYMILPGSGNVKTYVIGNNTTSRQLAATWIRPSDYQRAGVTPKLKIRVTTFTQTAPDIRLAASLRNFGIPGGEMTPNPSAAVAGSEFTTPTLPANQVSAYESSEFSLPSEGLYGIVVQPTDSVDNHLQVVGEIVLVYDEA